VKHTRKLLGLLAGGAVAAAIVAWVTRDTTILRLENKGGEVVVTRDLVYRSGSTNPKHRLDVYAPKDAKGAPVVHFVHGGYWVAGDKDYYHAVTGLYGSVGKALAAQGIVTVVQSYRLVPEATFDDLVDDVMTALRWTEEHAAEYGGDPSRVFMMGHSAGGHVVALIGSDDAFHTSRGMNPDVVRGYIPLSAIWDIADMAATQPPSFQEKVTYPVFGRDPARWASSSPFAKLGKSSRPYLIAVGDRDYPYLIPQAERARDKLVAAGASPRWYVASGNEHEGMVLRFGAKGDNMTATVVAFVTAH
jgi:acetyl esterase/lipase